MSDSSSERCGYQKGDGELCRVDFALCDCHGQCFHHAPCCAEKRKEARKRGGKNAHGGKKGVRTVPVGDAPDPPESLEDAVVWASWATYAVATGQIDARTGHEIGYLIRALQDGLKAVDMEARVEELEERLKAAKKRNLEAV